MKVRFSCWLAPAAFALDRLTKQWAMRVLQPGERIEALPGLLNFVYAENTGAAFSILQGRQTLLLLITGVTMLAALIWLLVQRDRLSPMFRASTWLLLGGAAGNFYDRLVHGAVIDFLEFGFIDFPIFNVADCFVCAAFFLLTIKILFLEKEQKKHG